MGSKRQWYAMRKALQEKGKWTGGKRATHKVPAHEEGEPPEKAQALEPTPEPEGKEDDPEEGTSKAAQGE